jgi:hypothetical protein
VTTVQTRPQAPKGSSGRHKRVSKRRIFWRRFFVGIFIAVATLVIVAGISLGMTLRQPSSDPLNARVAEWARAHWLGSVVTMIETVQYQLNPPKIGGTPTNLTLLKPVATHTQTPQLVRVNPLGKAVTPVVSPVLPGEGQWRVVVSNKNGPVVAEAYLRPSSQHSSYLAGVAWMRTSQLNFSLHPGYSDPGQAGSWHTKDSVGGHLTGLVATWNGGFKIKDARGAFYLNGKQAGPMTNGAASVVIYQDRTLKIGSWGRDFKMTSDVVAVRQNLKLLIDHGKIAQNVDAAVQSNWGATIKGAYFVWRSGLGIRADGNLVYVAGDALSVRDLAVLLKNAGAVEGMQLDINPAWISYMWYSHGNKTTAHKLVGFQRPADRYLTPTSRDFFAAYLR